MNLSQFVSRIFGVNPTDHVEQAREYGRQHGRELTAAYVEGFTEEASGVLLGARQEFVGYNGNGSVVDAEVTPDYSGWTKQQLREACDDRGITYHHRHGEQSLIDLLKESTDE